MGTQVDVARAALNQEMALEQRLELAAEQVLELQIYEKKLNETVNLTKEF